MMFLRHLPLQKKIVTVTMLSAVAALLLTGGALFSYELRGYRSKLESDVTTLARIIGANSVAAISFGDRTSATETLGALRAEPQILAACIYGLDGQTLATFSRSEFSTSFPRAPGPDGFKRVDEHLTYFGAIDDERELRRVGTLFFEVDYSGVRDRLLSYAGILAAVLAAASIVAFALSTLLQRIISQPIIDLAQATKRVSDQRDYTLRVSNPSRDELGQLVAGFNEMLHQIQIRDAAVQEKNDALQVANKELESFSYSVSHDLRAPLRHVQGYVSMLKTSMEGKLTEKPLRFLKVIDEASVQMGQLIDDLLDFSRMGRSEMRSTRVALESLIPECIQLLDDSMRGRNIIWKISPLPVVTGDPSMLRQVIANLISNAVKYSRHRDPAEIEIGTAGDEGGRAVVFIRDNGAGFDMSYADKLFGVFQRLHRADEFEGTGIGLAIVRRVISRHGGRVWAEAIPDKGATFYFTLQHASSIIRKSEP
jgi:signal transduction histidine kinase